MHTSSSVLSALLLIFAVPCTAAANESGNDTYPDNITHPVAGDYVNGTLHESDDNVSDDNVSVDGEGSESTVSADIVSINGSGSEANRSESQGNKSVAGVFVNGTLYTTTDILSGLYVFEDPGVYIVTVSDKNATADLLQTMLEELTWTPTNTFSSLPMFEGSLTHEQIVWLLERQEVESIETDGIVSIATKELATNDSQVRDDSQVKDDRPISASVHASSQAATFTLLLGFGLFLGRGGL